MPALSPTMTEGSIVKWNKKEGDRINVGDVIAQVETDKATIDFEAQDEGFLAKILVPEGIKNVPVNKPVAITVEKLEDVAKFKDYSPEQSTEQVQNTAPTQQISPQSEQSKEQVQNTAPTQQISPQSQRVAASPLAKAIARDQNVDISQISGTGPGQRVIKSDVLEYVATQKGKPVAEAPRGLQTQQPVAGQSFTDIPVSNIRKVTAERLLLSKQTIPHYYLTTEIRVDQLQKVRAELNAQANDKYKLSINDFIIKAAALSMQKVPTVNSSWNEQFIRRYATVDINVAVNTEQGLFTPIVKDADKKGLADISNIVKTLATKAKNNKLLPSEFQGGTFTISNLGMFGIKHFAAVINPPQAAILAVGGTEQRILPKENKQNSTEPQYDVGNILAVTLSCDHRVVDGAVGAEWLQVFKDYLENPLKMLL